jgi:hypothetical protein
MKKLISRQTCRFAQRATRTIMTLANIAMRQLPTLLIARAPAIDRLAITVH